MKENLEGLPFTFNSKRIDDAIITIPVNDNYLVLMSTEHNTKIEPIIGDILQKLKCMQTF